MGVCEHLRLAQADVGGSRQRADLTDGGGTHISQRPEVAARVGEGVGQRAADVVARFGGSWTFIGLFLAVLLVWVAMRHEQIALLAKLLDKTARSETGST